MLMAAPARHDRTAAQNELEKPTVNQGWEPGLSHDEPPVPRPSLRALLALRERNATETGPDTARQRQDGDRQVNAACRECMESNRSAIAMNRPQLDHPCRNSGGGTLIKIANRANRNFTVSRSELEAISYKRLVLPNNRALEPGPAQRSKSVS